MLDLPETLCVHDVFHVPKLRLELCCHGQDKHVHKTTVEMWSNANHSLPVCVQALDTISSCLYRPV